MTAELHNVLLGHLAGIFAPITSIRSADDLTALFDRVGWDLAALTGAEPAAVVHAATDAEQAVTQLADTIEHGTGELEEYAVAAAGLAVATGEIIGVIAGWSPPAGLTGDDMALLPVDLTAYLLDSYLRSVAPRVAAILQFAGVLGYTAANAVARSDGTVVRRAMARPQVDMAQLGKAVTDPLGLLADRFLHDETGVRLLAEQAADIAGPLLAEAVTAFGAYGAYGVPTHGAGLRLTADELAAARHMLIARYEVGADADDVAAALAFLLAVGLTDDTSGRGLGLVVAPSGELDVTAGPVHLTLAGSPGALLVTGSGADFDTAGATLTLTVAFTAPADPVARFGSTTGTRFEVGAVAVTVTVGFAAGTVDFGIALALNRIVLAIAAGDGDGFLAKVLPKEPIIAHADISADWSLRGGLTVHGSGGLEIRLPAHLSLGPITLDEVVLAVRLSDAGLAGEVGIGATLAIGPLVATVQGIGLRASVVPGGDPLLAVGFKPPTGIGFSLDAGPVKGGGLVSIDEPAHQYIGILYLDIASVVTVTVVGILTTRMPDGSDGYSLLLLVTAEFPPIQLGYGFALTGLGGLVGINRTFVVEALQAGVRTGALGAILFPKNPVANATQLITTLKTVFPPAAGRYVFGPMVKLGWGPNQLLSFELGLILELPSPLRLVIVGKILVVLPDKDSGVVQLRLDVLGVLDFARGEVSVDASLIDSKIAAFAITGDMALRAGWKATKGFTVAVGGFHPKFTPPPGFPSLKRLAISLATGDNPVVRLETYFAVTSNTIQFGGGAELSVSAGPFSARAFAGLDALIQFSPFHMVVTLSMGIDVSWNNAPLLHAQLEGVLEGPNPWHVSGSVEFHVLLLSGSLSVDLILGEPAPDEPLRVVLADLLRAALLADDAWSGELPDAGATGVSPRSLQPTEGLVVHPLGRFSVRQRTLPLDTPISQFGAAKPAPNTPTTFSLTSVAVGGAAVAAAPAGLTDYFAAAQFADLTDDEKLSRPAFEPLPSGATAGMPRYRWLTDAAGAAVGAAADLAYDEAVLRAGQPLSGQRQGVPLDAGVGAALARDGLAGHSPARTSAVDGPQRTVKVVGERYVSGPAGSVPATTGATSYIQAAARRQPGERVLTVAEVS